MSQYGAMAMANIGYKYDEILKHYYTDVEIKKF
jgi:stage II sporulation protein D